MFNWKLAAQLATEALSERFWFVVKSTYCEPTKQINAIQLAAMLVSFAAWGRE